MLNPELLSQLSKLKEQTEESKNRLSLRLITEESGGGLLRITMNGNRELKGIEINADLSSISKEDLEDLMSIALTRVMDKVNLINEEEVMQSARQLFPGM